jgi:hypothetical protein
LIAVVWGHAVILIMSVHEPAQSQLFHVAQARDALGLSFRLGQSRQKQTRQDCDDGDYNQKFDEGEGVPRGIVTERLK